MGTTLQSNVNRFRRTVMERNPRFGIMFSSILVVTQPSIGQIHVRNDRVDIPDT